MDPEAAHSPSGVRRALYIFVWRWGGPSPVLTPCPACLLVGPGCWSHFGIIRGTPSSTVAIVAPGIVVAALAARTAGAMAKLVGHCGPNTLPLSCACWRMRQSWSYSARGSNRNFIYLQRWGNEETEEVGEVPYAYKAQAPLAQSPSPFHTPSP